MLIPLCKISIVTHLQSQQALSLLSLQPLSDLVIFSEKIKRWSNTADSTALTVCSSNKAYIHLSEKSGCIDFWSPWNHDFARNLCQPCKNCEHSVESLSFANLFYCTQWNLNLLDELDLKLQIMSLQLDVTIKSLLVFIKLKDASPTLFPSRLSSVDHCLNWLRTCEELRQCMGAYDTTTPQPMIIYSEIYWL